MLKKVQATLSILIAGAALTFAQTGALKVKLFDKATNETIPFAPVIALLNGEQVGQGTTNIDGEVIIKPLNPGKYTVKASYVGYQSMEMTGIIVSSDKTAYADIPLQAGITLKEFVKVEYKEPLIDRDTKSGGTVTREEYQNMASKNINSVAATTAGVYQSDEGRAVNMRGSRSTSTNTYVDGILVIGSNGVPQQGVEQVTTITGGIPAQYGDATGGIISVTTRGPQATYSGAVELISSQFLDAFGYNSLGFSAGGPLIVKKDTAGKKTPKLGFFISGQATSFIDPNPSAIGVWKVNDEKLKELEESPLRLAAGGTGLKKNADYLRMEDMEHIKAKQNAAARSLTLNTKLDYKLSANTNLTFGGSVSYGNSHNPLWNYSLLNSVNNPLNTQTTWRGWGKITQKFGVQTTTEEEKEKSGFNILNAFYTLQAGYTKVNGRQEDDSHKDNLFNYGYVGKFKSYKMPYYLWDENKEGFYQAVNLDTLLTFEASDVNPTTANYTKQVYELIGQENINRWFDVQNNLGLMNGDRPLSNNVYSLWYNTGYQWGSYQKNETSQFGLTTNFSADIKNHAVQVGLEYQQREERSFFTNAPSLWTIMRQLANLHIEQLDTANPIFVPELSGTYNYYRYNRKYDAATQAFFDKKLREKLGMPVNSTEWIDIDSYDPSTYSLDMFSADELLQNGGNSSLVGYYGYDYTGKKIKGNSSLEDFFNEKDENGNYTRMVPSFRPIYMAGYIQDKFDFRDIKFNVGVRIDRYDANQKVLKDKYLLDEAKTAGETDFDYFNTTKPSNIGDDYVVYVNDLKNPTAINGYRNGDRWYNANGEEISDPNLIKSSTGIAPYLLDPNKEEKVSSKAFKDYEPQVTVMPRIAFAFPISNMANFFAHYDLLTERPDGNRLDPFAYYFIENMGGLLVRNPDLKPQKTTDYELGFSQILSERENSSITLSAFYREFRDMIQVINVTGAYPANYLTLGNIDFGTVKGFSAGYQLRRTEGVELNANYTLQFADGTGSSATDGVNLVTSGVPNLRTTVPLNFDQRHTIGITFDYRFESGADYKGPSWTREKDGEQKTVQFLSNMGANLLINAGSGTPYSKQANITQGNDNVAIGVSQRSSLKGSIKGSNLPWQMRMNLRVDKSVKVKWGGKEEEDKKVSNLNIYVQVFNLLNRKNILNVYKATGNPDDDGYLAAAEFQSLINQATDVQSYRDLYSIKVNDPNHYSLPRQIRLGLILSL